jgi:hypothetical protein
MNYERVRKNWTVDVKVDEHEGLTHARARLQWREEKMIGVGWARLDPADRNIAEIGDELAVARALTDLGKRMLRLAADDIERATHQPADLEY